MSRSWLGSGKSIKPTAAATAVLGFMPSCAGRAEAPAGPDRADDASARYHAIMAPRRVRTTDSRHDLPIAPNLNACNFTAEAPSRVSLADISTITRLFHTVKTELIHHRPTTNAPRPGAISCRA